jgi:hypothetical protein
LYGTAQDGGAGVALKRSLPRAELTKPEQRVCDNGAWNQDRMNVSN